MNANQKTGLISIGVGLLFLSVAGGILTSKKLSTLDKKVDDLEKELDSYKEGLGELNLGIKGIADTLAEQKKPQKTEASKEEEE